jgi:hypothetical protein
MKKALVILLVITVFFGCKINQRKNNMRQGHWIERDTINKIVYKSKGRYKNDEEIKTWKFYINNKISKIEKYENNICMVTTFYPNGKIESKGQTNVELSSTERHWFYFGDWTFFDENNQIYLIRTYEKGVLKKETAFKN